MKMEKYSFIFVAKLINFTLRCQVMSKNVGNYPINGHVYMEIGWLCYKWTGKLINHSLNDWVGN